jgi:hypothetical protein
MAIPDQAHNIMVLETHKVIKLEIKLLIIKIRHVIEQLDGNGFPIFLHSLFNYCTHEAEQLVIKIICS